MILFCCFAYMGNEQAHPHQARNPDPRAAPEAGPEITKETTPETASKAQA